MRGVYLSILYSVIFHEVYPSIWVQLDELPNIDKFFSGNELRAVHPCGYKQCKKQCERRTDCSHVNYIRNNFTCLLMSNNSQSVLEVREGTVFDFKNNSGICSEIGCATPYSTCIQTKPGSNVCLKDLIHCKDQTYSVLNGTKTCIKYDNTSRAWQDANDFCNSTGGRLPVINTEIKLNRMLEFLTAQLIGYIWVFARKDPNLIWKWENGDLVEIGEAWSVVGGLYFDECLELNRLAASPFNAMDCFVTSTHTLCEEI